LSIPYGRQTGTAGISNLQGRQSPSLQNKVHPKITSSPIIRRVRKSSANKPTSGVGGNHVPSIQPPNIRKSISMDNMAGWTSREIPDKLVECQEEYIDNGKEPTTTVIGEENADVTTPLSDNLNLNHGVDDVKFREVEKKLEKNGIKNMPDSYTTLPRSFSRGKNISRSLVPKMRKLFEKSRSCDPELPHVKIRIQSEPNNGNGATRGSRSTADGTESARSSFVMLGPNDTCIEPREVPRVESPVDVSSISGSSYTLDDVDAERFGRDQTKQQGFLNKCATKVRSFMGKSQERE